MIRSLNYDELKACRDSILLVMDKALNLAETAQATAEVFKVGMREFIERRIKNPVQLDEQRYEYCSSPETYFNFRFGDYLFYITRVDDNFFFVEEHLGAIQKNKFDTFSEALMLFCDRVGVNNELFEAVASSESVIL